VSEPNIEAATVWIVDDISSNRSLFASIVETLGHHVETFADGETALEAASESVPDLILLDVMMPGMDGFQSCRALRRKFADEVVPIVMITANPDRAMYSRGLEAGADDYLFQPIDVEAMRSRINAMLRLRHAYQEVSETKQLLAARVELLRREVAEAERLLCLNDRLQSIGLMVAGIAHEIKNPLAAVRFNLDWAEAAFKSASAAEVGEALSVAREATSSIEALVEDLSTFARPDRADGSDRTSVIQVVDSALRVTRHSVISHAKIVKRVAPDLLVRIPPRRLAQVIVNLLVNAARAVAAAGGSGTIEIAAKGKGDDVLISVDDSGVGLPPGDIFEAFYTTAEASGGSGLGLSICAQIVRRAGGEIGSADSKLGGAKIWLRLPAV
jgi:signal transduction histidine kinase